MLWLQLPVLHKKHAYLVQLFAVSFGIHCLVIGGLLISLKKTGPHALTIHGRALSEAPIVLMPLHKVVYATDSKKIAQSFSKKIAVAKKLQPQKKILPKALPALSPKIPKQVIEPKKVVAAKPKASIVKKKMAEKKPEVVEKKVEKQPEPQPEVAKQEVVKPEVEKQKRASQEIVADAEVIHVGREELVEIALQRHVMEQLKKVWQPPAGISQDVYCSVYFVVDDEGKAMNVRMEQSSGSVLYDIGARTAILRAQFPVQARKKEFTIAFKP